GLVGLLELVPDRVRARDQKLAGLHVRVPPPDAPARARGLPARRLLSRQDLRATRMLMLHQRSRSAELVVGASSSCAAMSVRTPEDVDAQKRIALLSVGAAVGLVAIKLAAGLASGSLGLIAEAAHSGTDLVAALLTLFAIRIAVRPADEQHHYGHGKAEHLAALAESTFLILVSAFLGYRAVGRLVAGETPHVDATWWTFAVLGVVIAIDTSRTVVSGRAARRLESAALASNALHFASDLAGSIAVLIGLIFVAAGEPRADAVAALIVAVIVLGAAARLAGQSIQVLMDRADEDAQRAVRSALDRLEDVELRRARVRYAAGRHFVDLVVAVRPDAGITQ